MLQLHGHLFSSYTWKSLILLYANDTPFEFVAMSTDRPLDAALFSFLAKRIR